jgi:hypothetical protein
MIHINTCLLTREDHDADIKFKVANFGHNPYTAKQGDYVGRLIMLGVDEVISEFVAFEDTTHDFVGYTDTEDDEIIHKTRLGELENALAATTIATNKPLGEYQKRGGPETAKLCDPDAIIPEPSGVLQPFASRTARMCRYDLLLAVCGLASCTTKWTHQCDRDLCRLICYINTTKDHATIGWCGDPSSALELRVYADADFAGCIRTMRSTAGVILAVSGPNARVILAGVSKRQTAVSRSRPEAEIIAADHAMRAEGIPALSLLDTIFARKVHLRMMEDNEAMIKIGHSGKNPTMRYRNRTHKVGVAWLMEVFNLPKCDICKLDAKLQVADIGTKRITCVDTWRSNCVLASQSMRTWH